MDDDGTLVSDVDRILSGGARTPQAARGGAWPSSPGIDAAVIAGILDAFGANGERRRHFFTQMARITV